MGASRQLYYVTSFPEMLRAVRVEPKVPCEVAQGVLRVHPEAVHSCLRSWASSFGFC